MVAKKRDTKPSTLSTKALKNKRRNVRNATKLDVRQCEKGKFLKVMARM